MKKSIGELLSPVQEIRDVPSIKGNVSAKSASETAHYPPHEKHHHKEHENNSILPAGATFKKSVKKEEKPEEKAYSPGNKPRSPEYSIHKAEDRNYNSKEIFSTKRSSASKKNEENEESSPVVKENRNVGASKEKEKSDEKKENDDKLLNNQRKSGGGSFKAFAISTVKSIASITTEPLKNGKKSTPLPSTLLAEADVEKKIEEENMEDEEDDKSFIVIYKNKKYNLLTYIRTSVLFLIPILLAVSCLLLPFKFTFESFLFLDQLNVINNTLLAFDIIYAIYMLFNATHAFKDTSLKKRIYDKKLILINYWQTGTLKMDVFAIFPFESIFVSTSVGRYLVWIKIVARLWILEVLADNIESKSIVNTAMFRIGRLVTRIFMICHLTACLWHEVGVQQWNDLSLSWISAYGIQIAGPRTRYVCALYWTSTTIISVGYGDIHAVGPYEMVFSILAEVAGAVIFGFIIANISGLWEMIDKTTALKIQKLGEVKAYLRSTNLPKNLEERILKYFEYFLERKSIYDENEILNELPPDIRKQVLHSANKKAIESMRIFDDLPEGVVLTVLAQLKPLFHVKNDVIARQGELGHEMFFLQKGTVQVYYVFPETTAEITIGYKSNHGHFGEISLLKNIRRTANLRAYTQCDLYTLKKTDLHALFEVFPQAKVKMIETMEHRLKMLEAIKSQAQKENAKLLNKLAHKTSVEDLNKHKTLGLKRLTMMVKNVTQINTLKSHNKATPSAEISKVDSPIIEDKLIKEIKEKSLQESRGLSNKNGNSLANLLRGMRESWSIKPIEEESNEENKRTTSGASSAGKSVSLQQLVKGMSFRNNGSDRSALSSSLRLSGSTKIAPITEDDGEGSIIPSSPISIKERISLIKNEWAKTSLTILDGTSDSRLASMNDLTLEPEEGKVMTRRASITKLTEAKSNTQSGLEEKPPSNRTSVITKVNSRKDVKETTRQSVFRDSMAAMPDELDNESSDEDMPQLKHRKTLISEDPKDNNGPNDKLSSRGVLSIPIQDAGKVQYETIIETPRDILARGIFLPEHRIKRRWDEIMFFITLYATFYAPVRIVFGSSQDPSFATFNVVLDVFFMLDILVCFRTAYRKNNNLIITVPRYIAIKYLKGWFAIDTLGAVPVDIIGIFLPDGNQLGTTLHLLRLLRVIKLYKLLRSFDTLKRFEYFLEHNFNIGASLYRIFKLVCQVGVISHFLSCLWYGASNINIFPSDAGDDNSITWYSGPEFVDLPDSQLYLASFYWTITTLSTVGYGDISAKNDNERIVASFAMICGGIVFAYFVGSMASILSKLDENRNKAQEKLEQVKAYLKDKPLSHKLRKDVLECYVYILARKNIFDEEKILSELSENLRREVVLHLNQNIIEKIPFLAGNDADFITMVVSKMQPQFFMRNHFIFREGEMGSEMYFLVHGVVEVLVFLGTENEKILAKLSDGCYFGEVALLHHRPRTATIKCLTFCNLFSLHRSSINEIASEFPFLGQRMQEELQSNVGATAVEEEEEVKLNDAVESSSDDDSVISHHSHDDIMSAENAAMFEEQRQIKKERKKEKKEQREKKKIEDLLNKRENQWTQVMARSDREGGKMSLHKEGSKLSIHKEEPKASLHKSFSSMAIIKQLSGLGNINSNGVNGTAIKVEDADESKEEGSNNGNTLQMLKRGSLSFISPKRGSVTEEKEENKASILNTILKKKKSIAVAGNLPLNKEMATSEGEIDKSFNDKAYELGHSGQSSRAIVQMLKHPTKGSTVEHKVDI